MLAAAFANAPAIALAQSPTSKTTAGLILPEGLEATCYANSTHKRPDTVRAGWPAVSALPLFVGSRKKPQLPTAAFGNGMT